MSSSADRQVLYAQLKQAEALHNRAFRRYVEMAASGYTRGRFYSQEAIAKALTQADEALAEVQRLQKQLEDTDDEKEQADK